VVQTGSAEDVAKQEAKMINQNIEGTRRSVARKLNPQMISTSTLVRSLLGYLLNERWTEPHIIDLRCAGDEMLLAYESNSHGYLRLLCSRNQLIHAILVFAHLVELTPRERTYLLAGVPSAQPLN
jgi:hypothetical protein